MAKLVIIKYHNIIILLCECVYRLVLETFPQVIYHTVRKFKMDILINIHSTLLPDQVTPYEIFGMFHSSYVQQVQIF